MIDQHTLGNLEYESIVDIVRGKCLTPYGSELVSELQPMFDRELIDKRLTEVSQMKDLIEFGTAFPLYRLDDCRELIDRATTEGLFIEPSGLLVILELIEVSSSIHDYDKDERHKFPAIAEYLPQIRSFPEIKKAIKNAIDESGEVKDSASQTLKRLRIELQDTRRRVITRLEGLLSKSQRQAGWQDDVVTQRNGRYVIPVIAGSYSHNMGILHDRSQSGATFYVEPAETVELNNRLNSVAQQERQELDRILRELTRMVGEQYQPLMENCRLIGILDSLHAAAMFGREISGNRPMLTDEPILRLRDARHPLLIRQLGSKNKVIPFSLDLDNDKRVLLITGPNTGGKTVTLKSVGLLVLMNQSGLLIPASGTSEFGIFNRLFSDIGDEQSIELSLSTFSSHIRNIIRAVKEVDDKTLILFDEIGAGTDPKEGAALAESIVKYLAESGCKMIVTTHYSHLKTLPLEHSAIGNASLEFNRDTLQPTYRLHLGIPGSSYAIEIAGRLGLSEEICKQATEIVGDSEQNLTELIASLEKELSLIRDDRHKLTERLEKAEELGKDYKTKIDDLNEKVEEKIKAAIEESQELLDSTRREMEHLVAEIRRTNADKRSVKQFHQAVRSATHDVTKLRRKSDPNRRSDVDQTSFSVGDSVHVLSLNQDGEIEELLGENRARVRIRNVTITVEIRNLEKLHKLPIEDNRQTKRGTLQVESSISPEIHLRGMTVDEATEELDRFLDRAVVSGLSQVYVIHGKGTGTLRRTLNEFLKSHREVETVRLGNWDEGGAGVTVVKLRS